MKVKTVCGGLNPLSTRAIKHAVMMYESIRKRTTDCMYIANNTGFTFEQVSLIKSYIFYNRHVLDNGRCSLFDANYEMAESWRRLSAKSDKYIKEHDIILLHHELLEIKLILDGHSQHDAHEIASKTFDYGEASNKYYRSLGFKM